MSSPRRSLVVLIGAFVIIAGACSNSPQSVLPTDAGPVAKPTTLLTIGGSATEGDGTEDRLRDAWPYIVLHDALPLSSVLVNAALDDQTVARAIADQLPIASDVKPNVVAIWLGADDVLAGTPRADFTRELTELVESLRADGAQRILVADLPAQLGGAVGRYNAAIRAVVTMTRAELVELARTPITVIHVSRLPDQPDTASHRAIAAVFTRVLRSSP